MNQCSQRFTPVKPLQWIVEASQDTQRLDMTPSFRSTHIDGTAATKSANGELRLPECSRSIFRQFLFGVLAMLDTLRGAAFEPGSLAAAILANASTDNELPPPIPELTRTLR